MIGVALQELDQLGDRHEAVRVLAVVGEARQPRQPVGREQPQRIPALGLPRVGDLAALEHDVLERPLRQHPADREAGMPGPDDHDGYAQRRGRAQATVTVTLVGLVSASKTAERFCDWATSAAISSASASASISKLTRMSL